MELQREGAAGADRLHLERVAFGEELGARRQVETLAVPLIDAFRPGFDDGKPGRGRPDRVIADLGAAVRMAKDFAAELPRAHLRAETDAEKRLGLLERHADPIDLAAYEIVIVVGAHRAAEDNGGRMLRHGRRQRIAEPRPAHIEEVSQRSQRIADAAGCGMLLVQNNQDLLLHGASDLTALF